MAAADAGVTALRNGVDHGHAASLRGRGRARDVDGSIHVTGYRTDGYGARVYEYERSLPGSVSILPLYGTGWRATALIGLRRGRLQVWWRGRYEVRAGDQPRWLTGLQVDGGAR